MQIACKRPSPAGCGSTVRWLCCSPGLQIRLCSLLAPCQSHPWCLQRRHTLALQVTRCFPLLTAGESHGPGAGRHPRMVVPAHLRLNVMQTINETLARRQGGYGRSARMKIERERARGFLAGGSRRWETLGSPIAVIVRNRSTSRPKYTRAHGSADRRRRPADEPPSGTRRLRRRVKVPATRLAQRARTGQRARDGDARLPRSNLRDRISRMRSASERAATWRRSATSRPPNSTSWEQAGRRTQRRCVVPTAKPGARMIAAIDAAKGAGDTLGGRFVVQIDGMPTGIRKQSATEPASRRDSGRSDHGHANRSGG